ncbi:MAG TPA: caspase family protein [Thermoanaerobaculia bacterium]|nr:caspase family protein [Thermoanaerobaculia bacterium]
MRAIFVAAIVAILAALPVVVYKSTRSVGPPSTESAATSTTFDPKESAALFVGVRNFKTDHTIERVEYAVDDAVDLAYTFAFDPRVRLVPPQRVALALSDKPLKPESQQRLRELKEAGATVSFASQSRITSLLRKQAAIAGRNGLFIGSFATHGFSEAGVPYVLAATSNFREPKTWISVAKMLDIAAAEDTTRSLILVDACRERVDVNTRTGATDPLSAAPLVTGMTRAHGQVVLYAAAAGKYSYDDQTSRNGVFTKAVIDGLQCGASRNTRGLVTAGSLHTFVESTVRTWVRKHRDPRLEIATQLSFEGRSNAMPLADCSVAPLPLAAVEPQPANLNWNEIREHVVFELFRKKEQQTVAISSSRLSIIDSKEKLLAAYDDPGSLEHVIVEKETNRHSPRIVVAGVTNNLDSLNIHGPAATVFMLDPKKVSAGSELWRGVVLPAAQTIRKLEIVDHDGDGKREIAVTTSTGRFYLDFEGHVIAVDRGAPRFQLIAKK